MMKMTKTRERIHPRCRESLDKALIVLEDRLEKGLLGICVIGSSTCSDWEEGSDIDLLFLTQERVCYKELSKIEEEIRDWVQVRVQCISMVPEYLLNYHLSNRTTMAHSIRGGVVIWDPKKYFSRFADLTPEDLPKRRWIKEYFQSFFSIHRMSLEQIKEEKNYREVSRNSSHDFFHNSICRVIVNYSILYLELNEIIPITKKQIIRGVELLQLSAQTIQDVEESLYIRREDRFLKFGEVGRFVYTAEFLKEEIMTSLGLQEEELTTHSLI